jgi:hypothetical protein
VHSGIGDQAEAVRSSEPAAQGEIGERACGVKEKQIEKNKQNDIVSVFASSEIALKDMKIDELGNGPHLADGMNLCAGCEDVFTLGKYCAFCQAMHDELVDRYSVRRDATRINRGIVPCEPYEPEKPASFWAVALVFLGAACSAMLTMTVLWYGVRGLIGFCLAATK